MLRSLVVVLSFTFCLTALGNSEVEKRRNKIIKIINLELKEVERLSNSQGERDPDLLLRLAELYLEKARLYRERENNNYLKLDPKKRQRVNKRKYFATSSRFFKKANQICLKITSRYRNYSKLGEVYYILGYNLKEAGQESKASKYLNRAGSTSKNKTVKVKSILTLADIYFNEKKFNKARGLYEKALSMYKDKWWTKDSFNLAWCYYHLNRPSSAIDKMLEVYRYSENPKFVDMRPQVERDIGIFYATSGKIDEGIAFYKKVGVNFTQSLSAIAFNLKKNGKFKEAERVLTYSMKYAPNANDSIDANLDLLDIHQKSGDYASHAKVVEKLYATYKANKFSSDQRKKFIFEIEKLSAILQRQVLGKAYKRLKKERKTKADQTNRYFEILADVDKSRFDEFTYLKAETAYAMRDYNEAFISYRDTFEWSVKYRKTKFKKKSMDNMLVTLSHFKNRPQANIYVFEKFIEHYPNDKRMKTIYERLFNNYMEIKDYPKAKLTIERYAKRFPKSTSQEVMIAKLMDVRRKQGDNDAIRAWVSDIEEKKFYVSSKYRNKLQELLTTMQMEDVQGELKSGNKKVAMLGYLSVIKDKYSTKKSKINAKYNLAALYFELGSVDKTYYWAKEAIDEMTPKDVSQFEDSFITMANFLFMSLAIKRSSMLSYEILKKTCKERSKQKNTVFKNAGFMSLAAGEIAQAQRIRKTGQACGVKKASVLELDYEVMREAYIRKNYEVYENYVQGLSKYSSYQAKMLDEYINLINIYTEYDNREKIERYSNLLRNNFYKAKRAKQLISIDVLDYFAELELAQMSSLQKQISEVKLQFPEQVFQQKVERLLGLLDKLVEKANSVISIGSGKGIISSYDKLNNSYSYAADLLGSFTPPGKSAEYIKGFKAQFMQISSQMKSAAMKYSEEAIRAIKNNEILSESNKQFLPLNFPVSFYHEGVLMDRGGLK